MPQPNLDMVSLDIDVGQTIAGKYELVRRLGKGAMGQVWLAKHHSLGGEFAVKLLEPDGGAEVEAAAGRFQFEAQVAAKLSRKTRHIVSVSDHGEEDGRAYLVMELLEGEPLDARMKRAGPLEMPEVAAIVSQIARALSVAHDEGIFHRDLKPANVWLAKDEDGRLLVKLLDFGIARAKKPFSTRSPFVTSKDMVLGTPSYMSPEQARGLASLDYRCDLWALAVLAYEALTNRLPFDGETVEDIFLSICTFRAVPVSTRRADLPPTIEAFFARAFAPNVDERFEAAVALSEAFEHLVPSDALEAAIGASSVRRLEVTRGDDTRSRSDPTLASGSSGVLSVDLERRSGPNAPPLSDAIHPVPTPGLGRVVAIAVVALLCIAGVLVVTFRGSESRKVNATSPVDAPSTPVTVAPADPPPSPQAPVEKLELAEPAPTPTSASHGKPRPLQVRTERPQGVARATPSATAVKSAASPVPPPARSVNKGDVF